MEFYFKKYLKYKNKYLELQNLYGGADSQEIIRQPVPVAGPIHHPKLKLLSEIANFTKKIYIKESYIRDEILKFFNLKPNFITDKYLETRSNFTQDSLIQFYNIETNNYHNYINRIGRDGSINPETAHLPIISYTMYNNLKRSGYTDLQIQEYTQKHGQIKTFPHDIIFPKEQNYVNILLKQDQVYRDGMIYDLLEQIKGGNFISSPPTNHAQNGILFYVGEITEEFREILNTELIQNPIVNLNCSFQFNNIIKRRDRLYGDVDVISNFRHVDEIMTFLPYGNGQFKIWIYDIEDDHNIPRDIYAKLKEEQKDNLEKISLALFGSNYESNIGKFFIIPINIGYPTFLFPKSPIFNLTYIEVREPDIEPYLFLSINDKMDDPRINDELKNISSFITGKPINIHYIDTSKKHQSGLTPGGNLHCLIKQEMEIP